MPVVSASHLGQVLLERCLVVTELHVAESDVQPGEPGDRGLHHHPMAEIHDRLVVQEAVLVQRNLEGSGSHGDGYGLVRAPAPQSEAEARSRLHPPNRPEEIDRLGHRLPQPTADVSHLTPACRRSSGSTASTMGPP
jgi:hypothetical protein